MGGCEKGLEKVLVNKILPCRKGKEREEHFDDIMEQIQKRLVIVSVAMSSGLLRNPGSNPAFLIEFLVH